MLLPLRVEEAEVDRLPWVSISIAAICVVMFVVTWVAPKNPGGLSEETIEPVLEYWEEHQYLQLPERLLRIMPRRAYNEYQRMHAKAAGQRPDQEQLESEQRELDHRSAQMFRRMDGSLLRSLALVPERGLAQKGLVTHMFLHAGWLHLLGNMLFFYIAALLLEDRWGRGFFAAFYLVGGIAAALGQYLLDRGSSVMMVGASGAVAACMGAFAVRFPERQIRMFYFFWIFRIWTGTFLVRAWLWGLFWFGQEVLYLALDTGGSGVAFAAHVGGFAFGALTGLGLKWSGVEARYLVPAVEEKSLAFSRHAGVDEAEAALASGDKAAARKALEKVLAEAPDTVDAAVMLIKLQIESDRAAAHVRAERFLSRLFGKNSPDSAQVVEELAPLLDFSMLRPATTFRMGQALLDGGPEGLRPLAEQLFAAAARQPGPFSAKALLRAAQARLDAGGEAPGALEYLEKLRAISGVEPDLLARAGELEQRVQELVAREREVSPRFNGGGLELEDEPSPSPEPEPEPLEPPPPAELARSGARVVEAQLGGMTRDVLSLVLEGGRPAQVSISKLLAVAVGVAGVPSPPPAPPKYVLYTDLVTSWGGPEQPAQVLRLKSSTLRLHNLYPGMKPQEAFGHFLAHLLDQSGATGLPDAAALRRGEYPRYPDVESFTRALYGG